MSELDHGSEVNETSQETAEVRENSEETGGESSRETQELAQKEAEETSGFQDSEVNDISEEEPSDAESSQDVSQQDAEKVGFSEEEAPVENPENAEAEPDIYGVSESTDPRAEEENIGFEDGDLNEKTEEPQESPEESPETGSEQTDPVEEKDTFQEEEQLDEEQEEDPGEWETYEEEKTAEEPQGEEIKEQESSDSNEKEVETSDPDAKAEAVPESVEDPETEELPDEKEYDGEPEEDPGDPEQYNDPKEKEEEVGDPAHPPEETQEKEGPEEKSNPENPDDRPPEQAAELSETETEKTGSDAPPESQEAESRSETAETAADSTEKMEKSAEQQETDPSTENPREESSLEQGEGETAGEQEHSEEEEDLDRLEDEEEDPGDPEVYDNDKADGVLDAEKNGDAGQDAADRRMDVNEGDTPAEQPDDRQEKAPETEDRPQEDREHRVEEDKENPEKKPDVQELSEEDEQKQAGPETGETSGGENSETRDSTEPKMAAKSDKPEAENLPEQDPARKGQETVEQTSDNGDASDYRQALDNMSAYMNEHNYGKEDYPEYSKDPEWQKLNADLQASQGMEVTPAEPYTPGYKEALDNMSTYMNEHNYGKADYPEYSKDPEWQKLNADLQASQGMEVTPAEPYTPGYKEALDNMSAYMNEHNYGKADYPEYSKAPEWQKLNADLQTAQGMEVTHVEDKIEGMAYTQGNNELGYEGTCGPTSLANSLNRVLETDSFTEDRLVKTAAETGNCCTEGTAEYLGGTTTEDMVSLFKEVTTPEDSAQLEVHEKGNALSVDELADRLKSDGTVAIVAVDSATLWDEPDGIMGSSLFPEEESRPSDHWIMVDKPFYNGDGELLGFRIVDSGGGESYVDRDKFEAMYQGNEKMRIEDQSCILIEKVQTPGSIPESTADVSEGTGKPKTEKAERAPPEAKHSAGPESPETTQTPETTKTPEATENPEKAKNISSAEISEMPQDVQESYQRYKEAGWPQTPRLPGQSSGTFADKPWQNRNGDLPTQKSDGVPITYREHDVHDKVTGQNRDGCRFVTGSDGSVYYTNDHYGTFTKLQ